MTCHSISSAVPGYSVSRSVSTTDNIGRALISEQFNLFTKESNIAVKQIRETSVIYCRIIRRHENNCKDILDMHATDVDLQH